MTKQTEALKLALEALEDGECPWNKQYKAITAIKEALAQPEQERCVGCEACIDTACGRDECPKGWPKAVQPEQEPVAKYTGETWCGSVVSLYEDVPLNTLFYTTPPQRTWVGLSIEDRNDCLVEADPCECLAGPEAEELMSCVEAKLKEKNT